MTIFGNKALKKLYGRMSESLIYRGLHIDDLVHLLENKNLTNKELVYTLMEGNDLTMKDIDKANKIILKKYKKNIKIYHFPADNDCLYAGTAHNECLCLYTYYRPKFFEDNNDDTNYSDLKTLL
jgi:hypothetical protein